MLYNYIKVNADHIVKATPSGYTVTELRKPSGYWTRYETSQFTNYDNTIDFTMVNSPRSVTNPFGVFIQNKSVTAKSGATDVLNALNISAMWNKNFPETIRLKYPGVIVSNNYAEKQKMNNEENYTFKIWENRSDLALGTATILPDDLYISMNQEDYFFDLLSFMQLDSESSYENWLKRPLFSIKNLLSKSIKNDGKLYQLYKVNDVNIQSLSESFDEYIPWCFDQHGSKIEQYKIAAITSFNRKEIYILLEIKQADVHFINEDELEIPIIRSIVFWRSGFMNDVISTDIRNKDQKLLHTADNDVSNISDYFRESTITTNTLVNFQNNRLENTYGDDTPIDNDVNTYTYDSNLDDSEDNFTEVNAKNILNRFMFGIVDNDNNLLSVSMGSGSSPKFFTDHHKTKVHIFVNGNLLTNDQFYIADGNITAELMSASSYVEIYVDQYDSVSYSFNLVTPVASLIQSKLSYILYNAGFLWKTTQNKEYLLFNKTADSESCKLVDEALVPAEVTTGNYLVMHSLFFDLGDGTTPTPTDNVSVSEVLSDVSDARDYNINYDPLLFKTSADGGSNAINDKDLWIFDNTKSLIKTDADEPYLETYLVNNVSKVKVMGVVDKNIALLSNSTISGLKQAVTQRAVHNNIIVAEKTYLTTHYAQMSTVNQNILNMFIHAGSSTWQTLSANTPITINKDYMIVWYNVGDDYPLLKIIKDNVYEYGAELSDVTVKLKHSSGYYILHRTDNDWSHLYQYSFSKAVNYIMI